MWKTLARKDSAPSIATADMAKSGAQIRRVIRDSGIASAVALVIGCAASFFVISEAHDSLLRRVQSPAWLAAVLLATLISLAGRFVRWHYLLRTSGVVLPTRESARLFFSSLAVLLTPLYLGEIAFKSFFLWSRRGTEVGVTTAVALGERLHDLVAFMIVVGVLGVWFGNAAGWLLLVVPLVFVQALRQRLAMVAAWPLVIVARLLFRVDMWPARRTIEALMRARVAGPTFLLSVVCWLPALLSLYMAGRAVGAHVGAATSVQLFCSSALLGGLSLLPAGIAIAGPTMLQGLTQVGVGLPAAVAMVAIVRLETVGTAICVGIAMLLWTAWRGEFADTGAQAHFDRVSEVYDAEIPIHVRDYLVAKKASLVARQLDGSSRLGLDLGCGRGYYLEEFERRGFPVVGVDLSHSQLRTPRTAGKAVVGNALQLPFPDGTFDFAYSVNLFHHLPSRALQRDGLDEVRRVLKPGGSFFLHEINVTNPVFRFYMGYVFPIVRNIDSGTERWLKPANLDVHPGLRLRSLCYFTFIPDFLPRWAVPWIGAIEGRLERSRWAHLSAHFVARFERT